MSKAFTLHVFVLDGDPDGVRIIDRMNWTGRGIIFPRSKWHEIRTRAEFAQTGVYILTGYREGDGDLRTVYIGQADGVQGRIDSHLQSKDFWELGIVFVSTSSRVLHRAHLTWLEYALVTRAAEANRCRLDNGNVPREPAMSEADKADTQAFLEELLQILPLVGLRVFEILPDVEVPDRVDSSTDPKGQRDMVVVPAKPGGFERAFLGQDCWYAIRISDGMLNKINYIAAYQTRPISAITHYAPVKRIEHYGDSGKYKLIFAEKATELQTEIRSDISTGVQSPRYASFENLKTAKTLTELFGG